MRLAFCLFKYFPYGGLQRDFLRIAQGCQQRGHTIDVYTIAWEGEPIADWHIHIIPISAWQNHTRCRLFAKAVAEQLAKYQYDLVIGFNKMPNLDIYYAADVCYQTRAKTQHGRGYRLLPRYRQWVALETAVFSVEQHTHILCISPQQQAEYMRCYHTPAQRFSSLPPGIDRNRAAPKNALETRQAVREAWGIKGEMHLLLFIGSGFITKGLDRVFISLAALPHALREQTRLIIIGQDNARPFQRQAEKLGVAHLVRFLGGRNDVPGFLLAADLLVHPAYHENTGTVLLEAMIAGLPVLTVDSCGYAHYVNEARAGRVLPSPFCQNTFNQTLQQMLVSPERLVWRQQGLQFGQEADIYSMPERAVACIEQLGKRDLNIQHLSFTQMMKPQGDCFRAQLGRRTQRILREGKAYFIKQHVGVGWKEIIKNLLQLRLPIVSANNEYQAIQKLQTLTVPVPTVVRYACRGWNPARLQSFLLTEEIAHQGSLEQYCQTWRQIPPTFTLKQALLKEVARIARVMHAHGINHRDFYLCHFLLDGSVDIAKCVKLYLIDLHRAQIRKKVPKRWLIKDLAGLYFSSKDIGLTRRDIYRFIQYYRQQPLHEVFALEPAFWQQVQQRGEKLYGKHQHSRNSLFTENS